MKNKLSVIVATLVLSSLAYGTQVSLKKDGVTINTTESELSRTAYSLSLNLLSTINNLAQVATNNNKTSQNSMLKLSEDIGAMADRINVMADKIGVMADRIVKTQEIQSKNIALTQTNLLAAQQNITALASQISNKQVVDNLQIDQEKLSNAIESNKVNNDILLTKNIDKLIEKMNLSPVKYRYRYVNAIKKIVLSGNSKDKEKKMKMVIDKIEAMQNADTSKPSRNNNFNNNPIGNGGNMGNSLGNSGGMGGGSGGGSGGGMGGGF